MCCFSQPVDLVADTNIFARSANGRQFLVYSMAYAAAGELAMVLPLPVPPNPRDDAVRFINLEHCPNFFDQLRSGFPAPLRSSDPSEFRTKVVVEAPTLEVHQVGSFEASFVPCLDDFDRLDERFRIPRGVWDKLPAYRDYGFAVFKLKGSSSAKPGGFLRRWFGGKPTSTHSETRRVHPMAFEFPRRNPDLLYFPTVHVHDREVHAHARFDHMLYCQADPVARVYLQGFEKSMGPAAGFMEIDRTAGIVAADQFCWRQSLFGRLENKDTLVGAGGYVPAHA